MSILSTSFLFFVIAALGGVALARAHVRGTTATSRNRLLIVVHPMLAAAGLILLAGSYVRSGDPARLGAALVLLVTAAAGGIGVAMLRARLGRAPLLVILLHALVALSGVGLVLFELIAAAHGIPPSV